MAMISSNAPKLMKAMKRNQHANPNVANIIRKLEKEMKQAAKSLDFERAAEIRDQSLILQEIATKSRQSQ
jgi:excinuclease UvrABC nuclease subunit